MFDAVWSIVKKDLSKANKDWDDAMKARDKVDNLINSAESRLQNSIAALDAVLKQCTGKTGKFFPVMDGEKIVGITVSYTQGNLPISTTLELGGEAPDTQADQPSLSE